MDHILFEANPGISVALLPDAPRFTIVAVSNDFVRISGINRVAAVGKGLFELFPESPIDPHFTGEQNLVASFRHVMLHKEPYELPLQRYDIPNDKGAFLEKYWRVCDVPVLNDAGQLLYIIHSAEDVTATVKAEKNEERLQTALEAANMGTWDYNLDTGATIVSTGLKRIFGLSPNQEFTYRFFIQCVVEEDRAHTHQVNQDVIDLRANQSSYDLQYRIKRANDGMLRWIRAIGKVHVDEEGKPYRFTGTLFDITNEKKAEERYQTIFETVPVSIWEKDYSGVIAPLQALQQQHGQRLQNYLRENKKEVYRLLSSVKITDINFAALEMFEAESKEQLLNGLPFVFTDETLPALVNELMAVANRDRYFQAEYVMQTLKGRKIICLTSITLPHDHDYNSVLVCRSDITDLKKVENALKESEVRFRTMANSIPQLAWMTDEKGSIYWYNDRWYDYTGTTPDEMLGWGWKQVHHPDLVEGVVKKFITAIENGSNWEDIFLLRSKTGEYRWFLSRSIPVRKEDGTLIGWFGTNTDITEQRKTEEALKQSEERFRTLAETLPQLVWMTDAEGMIEYASSRWTEYAGIQPVGIESSQQIMHPDDWPSVMNIWQRSLQTSQPFVTETRLKSKTGEYRWFSLHGEPLRDGKGHIVKWIGAYTDINNQKMFTDVLEKLVEDRTRQLHQSNEDLQQFIHVASHDLKEPVRKINTFLQLMQKELDDRLNEKSRFYFDRIQTASDRILSMIEGTFAYSTIGAVEEIYELVDLNEVIKNVATDLELVIQQKRATIHHDHLPQLEGIPTMLHQVFYNLISNSLKFTKTGVAPVITITSEIIDQNGMAFARIQLQDNGIGFEHVFAEKIFTTFTRLHSKDEYEGAGLGLSLCKKIIERHGGSIVARGAPNEGSVFEILLPAKKG